MKKTCKQCGAEFILTPDEIAFYQRKNLQIPKRCEKCRRENREGGKNGAKMRPAASEKEPIGCDYENVTTPGQVVRAYSGKENGKKRPWVAIAAALLLLAVGIGGFLLDRPSGQDSDAVVGKPIQTVADSVQDTVDADNTVEGLETADVSAGEMQAEPSPAAADAAESETAPAYTYTFRKTEFLQEHFEKHGAEFGYASAEEYLAGANRVVDSPQALHKLEAEDGDDVYYLESTNEFVIVSTDGFLRTYFKPNDGKAYFDRQ